MHLLQTCSAIVVRLALERLPWHAKGIAADNFSSGIPFRSLILHCKLSSPFILTERLAMRTLACECGAADTPVSV